MSQGRGAIAYTDEVAPVLVRRYDDAPRERPIEDVLTSTLGAKYYVNDKKFEYLRVTYLNRQGNVDTTREGERFAFKRFYPELNVIIDLIMVDNDKERKLVKAKREAIIAFNEGREKAEQLGYLPCFIFQKVHKTMFDSVKDKKVLDLPDRSSRVEEMMREKGFLVNH